MSDILSIHHPPAMRVGGRRLSMVSARPRFHNDAPSGPSAVTPSTEDADYPRPTAQGEGDEQAVHPPPHDEEEAPKKEKKHGYGGYDQNRLKESAYRKLNSTMPSKDHMGAKHAFGGAGRIGQPMGRELAV